MHDVSMNITNSIFVPSSRLHIHSSSTICTHEVGTFHTDPIPSILYTKGDKVFRKDGEGNYHYKNHVFRLDDGKLLIGTNWIVLPTRTNLSTLSRLVLSLGLIVSTTDMVATFDMQSIGAKDLLSTLTMLALKDMRIIPNSIRLNKQIKYGEVVFGAYLLSVAGSGKIKSTNSFIRWLNEEDTLQLKAKFFHASEHRKYQAGVHSMRYIPTEYADQIINTALKLLLSLDFDNNEIEPESLDFIVPMEILPDFRMRDIMLLLNDCVGYYNGFVIRPRITDDQFSRVYSVFTSIGSVTRKLLGFMNYDISAALQTICLQLVDDPTIYPLHQELMNDKYRFRGKVMKESSKNMDWVKKELTSADNRERMPKRYTSIPILKAYFEEALILRKEIIANAEPLILARATEYANPKFEKIWTEGKKEPDFIIVGKKESSVFFFIWTQWERQIREVMMSCFDDPSACHQVHDAVYTRQVINPKVIEAAVLEQTGFRVQISAD